MTERASAPRPGLRRRLAGLLRGLADRLAPSAPAADADALAELRERFPGAPDDWLQLVRAQAVPFAGPRRQPAQATPEHAGAEAWQEPPQKPDAAAAVSAIPRSAQPEPIIVSFPQRLQGSDAVQRPGMRDGTASQSPLRFGDRASPAPVRTTPGRIARWPRRSPVSFRDRDRPHPSVVAFTVEPTAAPIPVPPAADRPEPAAGPARFDRPEGAAAAAAAWQARPRVDPATPVFPPLPLIAPAPLREPAWQRRDMAAPEPSTFARRDEAVMPPPLRLAERFFDTPQAAPRYPGATPPPAGDHREPGVALRPWPDLPPDPPLALDYDDDRMSRRLAGLIWDQEDRGWSGSPF